MEPTTYLAIAGGCALFYALSLVTGGHHDLHHGDFGSDHGGHHSNDHHNGDNPLREFISFRSLLMFGLGFGVVGAIASVLQVAPILVPVFGAITGLVFAWLGIKFFRFLGNQDATTSHNVLELEGMNGRIVTAIPPGGVGEIQIRNPSGDVQYLRVRSEDGEAVEIDQNVTVVSVQAGDLVVRKIKSLPAVY